MRELLLLSYLVSLKYSPPVVKLKVNMHIFLSLQGSHKSTSLIAAVLEPSLYSAAATTVSAFIVKQSKPEGYGTSWYSLKHKHPQMKKCNLAIKQHAPPFNLSQQSSYLNAYKTTVQFILSWFSLRYVIIWKAQEENFTLSTQLKKKIWPVLASEYKANGFPEGSGAVFLSSIFKLVGLIGKSESQCNLGKRSLASI